MLEDIGFVEVRIGPPVDTFQGAGGERNARRFEVYGYPFLARKPWSPHNRGALPSAAAPIGKKCELLA